MDLGPETAYLGNQIQTHGQKTPPRLHNLNLNFRLYGQRLNVVTTFTYYMVIVVKPKLNFALHAKQLSSGSTVISPWSLLQAGY